MSGLDEFRTGWKIVLAATIGIGTGLTTLVFYSTGVFLPTLTHGFGWSDAQVMVSVAIVLLGASALGPLVGIAADRIGARPVALTSVFALGLAWMLMACQDGSLARFYGCVTVLTVAGAGTLPVTWTRAVIAHFKVRRGLALGLCLVGTGLFGIGVKQLAFHLMQSFGWRLAYTGIGAFLLLVTLPITALFFREATPSGDAAVAAEMPEPGLTLAQGVRKPAFWILAASFLVISIAISGIAPNLERYVMSMGFSLAAAVAVASWYGLGIIAGRIITGLGLDRFWGPGVVLVTTVPTIIAYVLLSRGGVSQTGASAAIFIIGTAAGVEYDALSYLVSRYFGPRAYSAIYGCIYIGFAIGAGFGPYLFSRLTASLGGYNVVLAFTAGALALGLLPLLALGRYPVFAARSADPVKV